MVLKYSESYYIRIILNKVKIKDLMSKDAISIKEDEPFSQVAKNFKKFHIRHLPVVNNKGKLVGLITQRDLFRAQAPRKKEDGTWGYEKETLDTFILKHVMVKKVFVLKPDHTVADALLSMVDKKYGCIPIVDAENYLRGIITQIDILRMGAAILKEGKSE